jgi:hypothetical protein
MPHTISYSFADVVWVAFPDVFIQPLPTWEDEWANIERYNNPALPYSINRKACGCVLLRSDPFSPRLNRRGDQFISCD